MSEHAARGAALTDPRTGLPNREYFDALFNIIFALGDRGIPISLLLLQVDAEEWDTTDDPETVHRITQLGQILTESTRGADLYAYCGGGLFAAVLLDCNAQGALTVSLRLEDAVAPWREQSGLTFSAGVAAWHPEVQSPSDLWDRASAALEQARADGGGRAQVARLT